jgi:hypothetical protein
MLYNYQYLYNQSKFLRGLFQIFYFTLKIIDFRGETYSINPIYIKYYLKEKPTELFLHFIFSLLNNI